MTQVELPLKNRFLAQKSPVKGVSRERVMITKGTLQGTPQYALFSPHIGQIRHAMTLPLPTLQGTPKVSNFEEAS
jgi:hypothetical protein